MKPSCPSFNQPLHRKCPDSSQSIKDETDLQLPWGSEYEMKVRPCAALVTRTPEAERGSKSVIGEGATGQTS